MHGKLIPFNKIKDVFGTTVKFPEKKIKDIDFKMVNHENPFKPSNPNKNGWMGSLAKFPKYIENPPK